jgi:hypothetical protein
MPMRRLGNPQGNVVSQLGKFANDVQVKRGAPPQLVVVVLPEIGNDLYAAVKQWVSSSEVAR